MLKSSSISVQKKTGEVRGRSIMSRGCQHVWYRKFSITWDTF